MTAVATISPRAAAALPAIDGSTAVRALMRPLQGYLEQPGVMEVCINRPGELAALPGSFVAAPCSAGPSGGWPRARAWEGLSSSVGLTSRHTFDRRRAGSISPARVSGNPAR